MKIGDTVTYEGKKYTVKNIGGGVVLITAPNDVRVCQEQDIVPDEPKVETKVVKRTATAPKKTTAAAKK